MRFRHLPTFGIIVDVSYPQSDFSHLFSITLPKTSRFKTISRP